MNMLLSPCCKEPLFDHREEDAWVWCAQCWKEFDKQALLVRVQSFTSLRDELIAVAKGERKAPANASQVSRHPGGTRGTPCK
jgi:hypothetical protein